MSTPITPTTDPTSGPVPAPQPSGDLSAVLDLAAELKRMATPASPPVDLQSGTIVDFSLASTPPTASVTIAGSATIVPDVRFMGGYTPVIGDTVKMLIKDGSVLILGHVVDIGTPTASVGGWVTPALSSGFTRGGNANANLQFRLIVEAGMFKMQWKGAVGHTGTNSFIISGAGTLAAQYRPAVKVSTIAARSVDGGMNTVGVDFFADGTIKLVGDNASGGGSGTTGYTVSNTGTNALVTDIKLSGYLSQAGSDLGHGHNVDSHVHLMPGVDPSWISFHGIEYFL